PQNDVRVAVPTLDAALGLPAERLSIAAGADLHWGVRDVSRLPVVHQQRGWVEARVLVQELRPVPAPASSGGMGLLGTQPNRAVSRRGAQLLQPGLRRLAAVLSPGDSRPCAPAQRTDWSARAP